MSPKALQFTFCSLAHLCSFSKGLTSQPDLSLIFNIRHEAHILNSRTLMKFRFYSQSTFFLLIQNILTLGVSVNCFEVYLKRIQFERITCCRVSQNDFSAFAARFWVANVLSRAPMVHIERIFTVWLNALRTLKIDLDRFLFCNLGLQ